MTARLPHEETLKLIKTAQDGDERAMDILTQSNLALVKSIVKRYLNRGYAYEDLYAVGCLGLVKAIKNYNLEFSVRFSTYAVPVILGEIRRYIRDDGSVSVSRSIKENSVRLFSALEQLHAKLEREPTVQELAEHTGLSEGDVILAMESSRPVVSLSQTIDDSVMMIDMIGDDRREEVDNRVLLQQMLSELPGKERAVITMRYFNDMTQSDIAERLNMTQVQVSRMESRILKKLRERI